MRNITFAIISLFCCATLSFALSSNKTVNNFILKGEISGQVSGKIILNYGEYSTYTRDTVKIKNGHFVFRGNISEPKQATLIDANSGNHIQFWIEPKLMHIKLSKNNYEKFKLLGPSTQLDQIEYNKLINSVDKSRYIEYKFRFIKLHPKSYVSINLLSDIIRRDEKNELLDSIIKSYDELDARVKKGFLGKFTKQEIDKKINNSKGAIAPDFSVADINNNLITMSSFKGKSVVLLDFWASWCVPCRRSFKTLKPLYNKFHTKGFEIIAIDCDFGGDKKKWKEAIATDSISAWYHVPIMKDVLSYPTEDDIFSKYFVQGVPRKILVDRNGIIVGNWMNASENSEKEVAQKIEEMFNQ